MGQVKQAILELEDLQKANWYLNRLIKEVSNGTS